MKNMERKFFWVSTGLKLEEIDWKPVHFNVIIDSHSVNNYGHLRYKSRHIDNLVSIDLVFNVLDPERIGGLLQETHGLPQSAVNCIQKINDPDCPLECIYRMEIRNLE